MDDNKRYSIWILVLFLIGAIFTVIWGLYLNKGELTVISKAPYSINILGSASKDCETDICSLELKPGLKTLVLSKANNETQQKAVFVERGENKKIDIDFQFIPYIEKLDEIPEITDKQNQEFKLAFDYKTSKQALFHETDSEKKVVSYFQRQLADSKVVVSDDAEKVAILENTGSKANVYIIDVKSSKRENVFSEFTEVQDLKFSPNNESFIIFTKNLDQNKNYLVSKTSQTEISFGEDSDFFAWIDNEHFLVASSQFVLDAKEIAKTTANREIDFEEYFESVANGGDGEEFFASKESYLYKYKLKDKAVKKIATITDETKIPTALHGNDSKIFFSTKEGSVYEVVFK